MANNKDKGKSKQVKINNSTLSITPCTMCNPKKYLKFSFAFISYESDSPKEQDLVKLWERMKFLSSEPFTNMIYKYGQQKNKWFEDIPLQAIKKEIPDNFRAIFPSETNEKYSVIRVYPAGRPNGTANPRIIGMIKHTVFYIFYLDWKGTLYDHGK